MTRTATLLRRLVAPHAWARVAAALLTGAGAALAAAAVGVTLAPRLPAVLAAWVLIAAVVVAAGWWLWRVRRAVRPEAMARLAERASGARRGSVAALVGPPARASAALLAAADVRAERALAGAAVALRRLLRGETARGLAAGFAAAAAGAALLLAASPGSGRAAAFWNPALAWSLARAPVRLAVDRTRVPRGDSVIVTVRVPGRGRATLWTRGPGEPWRPESLALDSTGTARRATGPLGADLFLRASSGARESVPVHVTVESPPFLADLALTARYPTYLARPDEPLVPGPDTVVLPASTVVLVRGLASTALEAAEWRREGDARRAALRVDGGRLEGRLAPGVGGVWRLALTTRSGAPLDGPVPELRLRLVPDSAPLVRLAVPGRDTLLPLSLRQPLVIDARDDHGLARLAVLSWRVSRTGRRDEVVRLPFDVEGERVVVQGELDLRQRRLLPGDTVRLLVEAWDGAPEPRVGRSDTLALRLPSMEELRQATREAARTVGAQAESVAAAQAELAARARDLAQERSRAAGAGTESGREPGRRAGALPFETHQRAEEVVQRQAEMARRVAELAAAVDDIARAARAAGVGDSTFQQRLAEVRDLLHRALTPELEQRLRELSDALERLDPGGTRDALQRLATAQERLRAELERSRELFRRAAAEGALASLAADAEALRDRQRRWTDEDAARADTAAAMQERELAAGADSLARGIEQAARDLQAAVAAPREGWPLAEPRDGARRAQRAMERAAEGAERGDAARAQAAGAEAADELEDLPGALRQRRDSLAAAWRKETLEALDRALAETAALAERQEEVVAALERGEPGAGTRGQQGAVEEGTRAIERQVREAAGRHALVSPALERALGLAQHQMRAARQQLETAAPNAPAAAALAQQAHAALNATAYALMSSRADVAGAQSGSGLQEAMEQLARLAGRQGGLAAEAEGLRSMLAPGGAGVLEQLRGLAARQRALADELERLRAGGASAAAAPLAEEARELANELDLGRLDRRTIERQERLYRRLLDAGRTLQGEQPDERKERVARAASGDSVRRPPPPAAGAGGGVRLRYPSWEELRGLTPEERRMVLEYFRRLNAPE